jgi:hypothetical protein
MAGRSKLIRRAYVRTTKVTEKTEPATAETTTMRTGNGRGGDQNHNRARSHGPVHHE